MIHSDRRHKLKGTRLNDLVFVHYNLKLKERRTKEIIAANNNIIDLGQLYPASDGEDAPFDWVDDSSYETDLDQDGRPNELVAEAMRQSGLDPSQYTSPERRPEDDLLVLDSPDDSLGDDQNLDDVRDLGASSDGGDDDGDGGDDVGGDNFNVDGGSNAGEEPPPEPIHFTGESQFQHGTQDENHGSRQGHVRDWGTRGKRSRQRRAYPDVNTGSSHFGYETSMHGDWTLNPAPPGYYPRSGDTSSYGYSYGDTEHTDYSNVGSNSLLSFANPGQYSQSGSSDTSRAGRSSQSMRAPSRGRRSNVQEQCENDRQWFPTDASSWLGAMMTGNESVPVSGRSHIEQFHGRPLLGYLLDNCPDQETYNIYVSQYEHNYNATMEWSFYCSHWLPQLARSTQSVQPDPDFVPGRASFWW